MIKRITKKIENVSIDRYGMKRVKFDKGEKAVLRVINKVVKKYPNVTLNMKYREEGREIKSTDDFNFYLVNVNLESSSVCICIDKTIDPIPYNEKLIYMDPCSDPEDAEKTCSLVILQLKKDGGLEIITHNYPPYMEIAIAYLKNNYVNCVKTDSDNFLCDFGESGFWLLNSEGNILRTSAYEEWEALLKSQKAKPRDIKRFKKAKQYVDFMASIRRTPADE